MLRIIRPIREQIFPFATSPSSGLAATFSLSEKENAAFQSIPRPTGRGGTTTVVGEGQLTDLHGTEKKVKKNP